MPLDRPPIAAEIRATLAVAAPLAAANLAQMAMQVTNAVMVGHLGAVPLAAAGLGNALNATLLMTSQGLLTAVAPLAAHSIGAGDHPAAGRVAGGGLIVAPAVAAPMMAMLMVVPPLLSGLGYEPGLVAEIGRFCGRFLGHSGVPRCGGAALPADSGVSHPDRHDRPAACGAAEPGSELGPDLRGAPRQRNIRRQGNSSIPRLWPLSRPAALLTLWAA
jgi:hypothetical protein